MSAEDQTGVAPPPEPRDLVKRIDVERALLADKGPHAKLETFEVKDFTQKGDNYACVVTSIEVIYTKDGRKHDTSYVVKLNPKRAGFFDVMAVLLFEKEIGIYTQILPLLNNELEKLKEPKLRTPKYLHSNGKKGEEVIYMIDLRREGFRMFDRKKGMDKLHTDLILKELARWHAASSLLLSREEFKGVDIEKKLPVLSDLFEKIEEMTNASVSDAERQDMYADYAEKSAKIAERNSGYEYVAKFLRDKKPTLKQDMMALKTLSGPFCMILHGDCWNNNFLFKYNNKNVPTECRLVDLQICRVGSPALDLNYMLYCSLNGDLRKAEIGSFFASYYAAFASVMAAAGKPVPFTLSQFRKEFYDKNLFGLFSAMMLIPIVLADSEDAPSFDDYKGEDMKKSMEVFQEKIMQSVQKNPLLTPRFLAMFDEMKENGLFDTSNVSQMVKSFSAVKTQ